MGAGSYASPSWYITAQNMIKEEGLGPKDMSETLATRVVMAESTRGRGGCIQ